MYVLSLQTLTEQIVGAQVAEKHLSGSVEDLSILFEGNNLEVIETRYTAFGFLAFDPRADHVIVDYLAEGTLAADSGARVLVLFTTARPAPFPSPLDVESLDWLELDTGTLPAQEMLRDLFVPNEAPPLPGIAFLRRFSTGDEAIYFPLGDHETAAALRQYLRALFVDVAGAADAGTTGRQFINHIAVKSQLANRTFRRGMIGSPRQWLISGYRYVKANAGDIIAAVGLFV